MTTDQLFDAVRAAPITPGILSSLISGAMLALLGIGLRIFNPRPRVAFGVSHQFYFNAPNAQPGSHTAVITKSVYVANTGSAPAEGLEILLNFEPTHFEIWPVFQYSKATLADGTRVAIQIPIMAPQERFTLEMLQIGGDMPEVLRVRHKSREAKAVRFQFNQVLPSWLTAGLIVSVFAGGFWIVKLGIQAVLFLAGYR